MTKDELEQKYAALCAQAGQLQFEIKHKAQQLDQLNTEILTIQNEFSELIKKEQSNESK